LDVKDVASCNVMSGQLDAIIIRVSGVQIPPPLPMHSPRDHVGIGRCRQGLPTQHDALEFPDAEIVLLRHQPVRANR
jgi:hypothetical protein